MKPRLFTWEGITMEIFTFIVGLVLGFVCGVCIVIAFIK